MRVESNLPNATTGTTPATTVALSRPGFAKAMDKAVDQALPTPVKVIQAGETLTSIVREQAQQQGVKLTPSEEFRWAQALAADSGIKNPNTIFPGQRLQLQNMLAQWQAGQTQPNTMASTAAPASQNTASAAVAVPKGNYINAVAHPVLSQTLDRAVARGFIPKAEKQDVYNKVLQVANKHNFAPDDFARLTLMESDGMNPKASNSRCHGIIQFCDGPDRGAASAGFGLPPNTPGEFERTWRRVEAARRAAGPDFVLAVDANRAWTVPDAVRFARLIEPLFLAGGLHAGNVADAIRAVQPHGLDVCSGVRTEGRLDAAKLQAFMSIIFLKVN